MLLTTRCYRCFGLNCKNILNYRGISTELTTALRPFYFAVHPDLFGQHPKQRSVNEDSLKQLSSLIENADKRLMLHTESKILQFYIRDTSTGTRDNFKLIRLKLDGNMRDAKTIVQRLLELCNLPTDYVKSIKTPKSSYREHVNLRDFSSANEFAGFTYNFYQTKEAQKKSLDTWLAENVELAHVRANAVADLREEVEKLQKTLIERLSLQDARYDCGWNFEHYRGCLKTLERMAEMHQQHMHVLRGRIVVFAAFTGISLEGHVMLYTGDVLNNWIDFIKNIPRHDAFLAKIPQYESTLSQVLRNIRIGRRKFMPKQQAKEYAGHLTKVTTTLGDYLTTNKFPKSWPSTLSDYEIVIESEAGPLMVNPTGQLIAPATCPGFMLVDFITTNMEVAKERTKRYKEQKYIEQELFERAKSDLKLKSLTKEDSITPDKMIETLQALLKSYTSKEFENINLHITNYYSVLADGIVCIPWDYMNR